MASKQKNTPLAQKQPSPPQTHAISQLTIRRTSGALPDAESFASYEATTPGAGERILAMAEKEQRHRHDCEKASIEAQWADQKSVRDTERRGQWFAFLTAISMLLIGGLLIYTDHPLFGTLVSGGTIIGVVTAFLQQREAKDKTPTSSLPKTNRPESTGEVK